MEDLFCNFGFIYILHSIYKMYNWEYGESINVQVDKNTTLEDIQELSEKVESQPKTLLSVIAKINGYLCYIWVLFGSFSSIKEAFYFKLLLCVIVCFYVFMMILGFVIAYQSVTNSSPRIIQDKEEKNNKPFPLCYTIEVTKIIIVAFVLFNHFILH